MRKLCVAFVLLFIGEVSLQSYRGIQPGFGLSQSMSEGLVGATGLLCVILAIFLSLLVIHKALEDLND